MESKFYKNRIEVALMHSSDYSAIAREVYLSYPTFSFLGYPEKEFTIRNEISRFCQIDFLCVQFSGSAKTGQSYHKNTNFKYGESDLDVAIISADLFLRYMEITLDVTNSFSDLTSFSDPDHPKRLKQLLSRGILAPEFMPNCSARTEWISFFENISVGNSNLFDNINAWIYSSQKIFELKISKTIHLLNKKTV